MATRYYKNKSVTINGLACYDLNETQPNGFKVVLSSTTASYQVVCLVGILVYKRTSGGVETEITAGTPVAQVTTIDGDVEVLYSNNSYTPTQTTLLPTNSIVIRVYRKFGAGAWAQISNANFTTEQLGAKQLDATLWTVYYRLSEVASLVPPIRSSVFFYWDRADNDARIAGFSTTPARTIQGVQTIQGTSTLTF
jgi:hypothetical protein